MFLSKKYQRSKQLQSNVPNAMTKTLKLSCLSQRKRSAWGSQGLFQSWGGYILVNPEESTTVSRMGCKTRDAQQEKVLLRIHACICVCV